MAKLRCFEGLDERGRAKVRDGECQGVRGVRRRKRVERELGPDQQRDLTLLRLTTSRDGALDASRWVLGDGDTSASQAEQHHAARVAELGSGLRVLVEEERFDRAHVGAKALDDDGELALDGGQSVGERRLGIGRDHAVRAMLNAAARARHDAPAEEACSGVDSEDDHGATVALSLGLRRSIALR